MRTQRFDAALRQLQQVKAPPSWAGEVAYLEALAWFGKALQADQAAAQSMRAIHVSGTAKHGILSLREQPNHAEFIRQVEPQILAYLTREAPVAAQWPAQFTKVLTSVGRSRMAARKAFGLGSTSPDRRDAAAALWAWVEVYDLLVVREAQIAGLRADTAGVFPPEMMAAIRGALPAERQPPAAELSIKAALEQLIPEAGRSKSPVLPLALAECLVVYSAAKERLMTPPFRSARSRFTNLRRTSTSRPGEEGRTPAALAVPADPRSLLTAEKLPDRLHAEPETFILPLYLIAAEADRGARPTGAAYGLYFALLAHNEEEAERVLNEGLRQQPRSAAWLLEKARLAAARQQLEGTQQALASALTAAPLRRQALASLPSELQPLALASPRIGGPMSQFLFGYAGLGSLESAVLVERREPAAQALRNLRLAELLIGGNVAADVFDGIWMAESGLERLRATTLSDQNRAHVEAYRLQLEAITARLPVHQLRPHLTFSTFEDLPDGAKRPIKTLTISPSGFIGIGAFHPGI